MKSFDLEGSCRLPSRPRMVGRLWVCLWLLLLVRAAVADDLRESQAEQLFRQARMHLLAGEYDQACPLFAESLRLDPASGTALNFGLCQERQGKLASAWESYHTALILAAGEHKPARERLARQRLHEMETRRSALVVSVPAAARAPGLVIELDGLPVPQSAWGASSPVDGGIHSLRATAEGRVGWQIDITLASERATAIVEVPALAAVPAPVLPIPPVPAIAMRALESSVPPLALAPPSARAVDVRPGRTWPSLVLGSTAGVSLAALAVGTYYGLEARSRWNTRTELCPGSQTVCADPAVSAGHDAERAAGISTAAFGVGIASAALTAYLAWRLWPDWIPDKRALRTTADMEGVTRVPQ